MSFTARVDLSDADVPAPHDGTTTDLPAVEVRGLYRGIVTSARILAFPGRTLTRATGVPMLFAGAALGVGALALFVATAISVGRERRADELWRAAGKAPQDFVVGSEPDFDAPIAAEFIPWPTHPLVQAAAGDYLINVTPRMTGTVNDNGRVHSLSDFTRRKGATFVLPRSGSAQLDCGATTFLAGGRILVQFTIAAVGRVISSVVQSSTMGNLAIENCTVQAVRRWEFPRPTGGGLVIVSYPFVLVPAGQ